MTVEGETTLPRRGPPDVLLLGSTVALLVIGTLMVYSSSYVVAHNEFHDDLFFLSRHLAAVAIGAVGMLVLARMDYHRWRGLTLWLLLGSVVLLVLVLIPGLGMRSYGAQRWIRLPFFQIQPSELAKIAIALYLADWLARRHAQVRHFSSGMLPFLLIVTLVAGLVELQPDLGTASIIIGTAAFVFFTAGANLAHVGVLGCTVTLGVVAMLPHLSGYRQDRIAAFLDPWSDLQGHGWHTAQTLIALGSGGLTGVGLGGSHQKYYWVPNAHTDAIFAIIGEEVGFIGTVAVLGLFAILAWRGYLIAWRAPDLFGRLLATGMTSLVVLQALVNIAVVTNSIPFTGVTLPLVSYGGNSTVVSMLAVGYLLSISRQRRVEPVAAGAASPTPPGALLSEAARSPGLARVAARLAEERRTRAAVPPAARAIRFARGATPRSGAHAVRRPSTNRRPLRRDPFGDRA